MSNTINLILDRRIQRKDTQSGDIQEYFFKSKSNVKHHHSLDRHLKELSDLKLIYSLKNKEDKRVVNWFLNDCQIGWRRQIWNEVKENPFAIYDILERNKESDFPETKINYAGIFDFGVLRPRISLFRELLKYNDIGCRNCRRISRFTVEEYIDLGIFDSSVYYGETCTCPNCGWRFYFCDGHSSG